MDAEDEQSKVDALSVEKCDFSLPGLEERLRAQNNSNTNNKPLSTRVTTATVKNSRYTFKDEKVETHTDKTGVCYRIGGKRRSFVEKKENDALRPPAVDHVYLETNKQAEPYSIACILDFRLVRRKTSERATEDLFIC